MARSSYMLSGGCPEGADPVEPASRKPSLGFKFSSVPMLTLLNILSGAHTKRLKTCIFFKPL